MSQTFLLAGNGVFKNRGCEAIAIGTQTVLSRVFGQCKFIYAGSDSSDSQRLIALFGDEVAHIPFASSFSKGSITWFQYQMNRCFQTSFAAVYEHLINFIAESNAILCLGGDHYTLDYGYPERFVQFDRLVLKHQKPLVYWCSSVGPFSAAPRYERKMQKHLGRVTAILARESGTVSYLRSLGITKNVHLVADPGFAMSAVKPDPARFTLDRENFIGVNFSTTVGRLALSGQRESDPSAQWSSLLSQASQEYEQVCRRYADIAAPLMKLCDENLVFVPHVTGGPHCDYVFLSRIADLLEAQGFTRPLVVPDNLTAPEYKWVISQARVFVGARTHSTIAAFSSGVPTISLAYSLKARGLTRDMYGTDEFCIGGSDVNPDRVEGLVKTLLVEEQVYRDRLARQAQAMTERAFSAGEILVNVVH